MPERVDDESQPVRDVELREDRGEVVAYRGLADAQPHADFLVAEAVPNQRHDLALARCQRREPLADSAARSGLGRT